MSPSVHGRPSICATYPGAERATCCGRSRLALPYSVLLRLELARFTPLRRTGSASSLWRWSSPRGGRVLPASLLCGARTFLGRGLSTLAPAAIRPPPGPSFYPIPRADIEHLFGREPPCHSMRVAGQRQSRTGGSPFRACRETLAESGGPFPPSMLRAGRFGGDGGTALPSDPIPTRGRPIWPNRRPRACHSLTQPAECSGRLTRRRLSAPPGSCRR